jgi:tetratricopeptide (TPR) repeat protein
MMFSFFSQIQTPTRFCQAAFLLAVCLWLVTVKSFAADLGFNNLLQQGEQAEQHGAVADALKIYSAAEPLASANCADLCLLTRRYCDLMHVATSPEVQKNLAGRALAVALRAESVNATNATARLCVAVCYAKNFPYVDTETKVKWSRAIKSECETAIALDPKQDVGYYLLGRWHFGVANMNIFLKGLLKIVYGGLPAASNEEAISNFKKAIDLAPNRIIHHFELAKVYQAVGKETLARLELEKCRDLKPLDPDDADAQSAAVKNLAELR